MIRSLALAAMVAMLITMSPPASVMAAVPYPDGIPAAAADREPPGRPDDPPQRHRPPES